MTIKYRAKFLHSLINNHKPKCLKIYGRKKALYSVNYQIIKIGGVYLLKNKCFN